MWPFAYLVLKSQSTTVTIICSTCAVPFVLQCLLKTEKQTVHAHSDPATKQWGNNGGGHKETYEKQREKSEKTVCVFGVEE